MKRNKIEMLICEVVIVILAISLALVTKELCARIKDSNEKIQVLEKKVKEVRETVLGPEFDVSMFEEIEASKIKDLSKNKKIVVFLGRSTCGYCAMFAPILADVQKDMNVKVYYIDMAKIIDYEGKTESGVLCPDANAVLLNLDATERGKEIMDEYGATPILLVIENNKILNGQVGYTEVAPVEALLKEEGFKNK